MKPSISLAILLALTACGMPPAVSPEQAAKNATRPGWTGRTFVVGSSSTIAGDALATEQQQKWPFNRDH